MSAAKTEAKELTGVALTHDLVEHVRLLKDDSINDSAVNCFINLIPKWLPKQEAQNKTDQSLKKAP